MVSFGHTAVGVVVGTAAYQLLGEGNLAVGLLSAGSAGFISHYFFDAIPHGHFKMPGGFKKDILKIIIFDLLLSILLFLGLIYLKKGLGEEFFYVLFAIGGSQLPDVVGGLININAFKAWGLFKVENDIHEAMHWHVRAHKSMHFGIKDIWQILVVLGALLYIL